jgi:zinc protease
MKLALWSFLAVALMFLGLNLPSSKVWAADSRPPLQKTVLPNGLTVILQESHAAPVVTVQFWVKVGSAREEPEIAGITHFIEHLIFKGTAKRKVGEIAREIEGVGGEINAYTSYDQTVYHVVLASRYLDLALETLSDAVFNPSFDAAEVDKERLVVLEEIKRGQDDPGSELTKLLYAKAFTKHPYGRPVIGYKEIIEKVSRQDIVKYHKKWYYPNNMALVVAGDFEKEKLMAKIKALLEKIPAGKLPPDVVIQEPEQKAIRSFSESRDVKRAYLMMSYPTPDINNPEVYALEVLASILGEGDSSRLFRTVKEEKSLIDGVWAYVFTPKDPGNFLVGATCEPDKLEAAQQAILEEIREIRKKPVSEEELGRAKILAQKEHLHSQETVQGQARQLGYFELVAGDAYKELEYINKIQQVSAQDVLSMAKKYLDDSHLTWGTITPSPRAGEKKGPALPPAKAKAAALTETKKPAVSKVVLENGITLLIKENPAVPLVSARAVFLGGVRFENDRNNGVSNFTTQMLLRGTRTRTNEQIAQEIENAGGSLNVQSGRNSLGMNLDILSRNFDKGLELLADCLQNPLFEPEEIEKARLEILASIKQDEDNLFGATFKLFARTLYQKHPYRFPSKGTAATVSKLGRKNLLDFYSRTLMPNRMVLAVVGDVKKDEVVAKVRRAFLDWEKRPFSPPRPAPELKSKKMRVAQEHRQKQQAHLVMGFLGASLKNQDRYALSILDAVLSGMGSRLFIELRDKESLAYALGAQSNDGLEPGQFVIYMGTDPAKLEQATKGILRELKKIQKEGITAEELGRAQRYLIGNYEIGLQTNGQQAFMYALDELYGLGYENVERYADNINKVTLADTQKAVKKYWDLEHYTLAVIKP